MTEDARQAALTDAEENRQTAQAQAADDGLDPNSPEGRQAAVRRGDPVQLTGEEGSRGMVKGTSTTSNESGAGFPASNEHNFVTGAAGVPIPASAGMAPQRPGDFNPESQHGGTAEDVALPPQEVGGTGLEGQPEDQTGPPPKSALKEEWVEHAKAQGDPDAENKTKEQLIEDHGQPAESGEGDRGDHGPGVSA